MNRRDTVLGRGMFAVIACSFIACTAEAPAPAGTGELAERQAGEDRPTTSQELAPSSEAAAPLTICAAPRPCDPSFNSCGAWVFDANCGTSCEMNDFSCHFIDDGTHYNFAHLLTLGYHHRTCTNTITHATCVEVEQFTTPSCAYPQCCPNC